MTVVGSTCSPKGVILSSKAPPPRGDRECRRGAQAGSDRGIDARGAEGDSGAGPAARRPPGQTARLVPVAVTPHVEVADLVAREGEAAGVLAQEAAHEDHRREVAEALLLEGEQMDRADLGLL